MISEKKYIYNNNNGNEIHILLTEIYNEYMEYEKILPVNYNINRWKVLEKYYHY